MNNLFKSLRLKHLEQVLPQLLDEARLHALTYDVFLRRALLLELEGRKELAHTKRLSAATLPVRKTLEEFDFTFQPTVSERLMWELAGLSFVQTHTNVVFLGPPGVGKTHLALALAGKALEVGYSVLFTILSHLASISLDAAPHPSLWRQRLRRYLHPRVLIIDEVGYTKLTEEQAKWGTLLHNEVLATALLDRLLHHAEVLAINGSSYRMKDRLHAEPLSSQI